jgi:hypothetical protein
VNSTIKAGDMRTDVHRFHRANQKRSRRIMPALVGIMMCSLSGCEASAAKVNTKGNTMDAEVALRELKATVKEIVKESVGPVKLTVDRALYGGEPCGSGKEYYIWAFTISPTSKPGMDSLPSYSASLKAHGFKRLHRYEDWVAAVNEYWVNTSTKVAIDISGLRAKPVVMFRTTTNCVNKTTIDLKPSS